MSHDAIYNRSPFLAGILSVFDVLAQAYQGTPEYPYASESEALASDSHAVFGDLRRVVERLDRDLEPGDRPTQLTLDSVLSEGGNGEPEFA